jgi:hypothetical protein
MKLSITKCITGFGITLFVGAIFMAGYTALIKSFDNCGVGDDQCIQRVIDLKRSQRDQQIKSYQDMLSSTETRYNNDINALKKKFSGEYLIKQAQAGQKQNVPAELLSLKSMLVQTALADTNDVSNQNGTTADFSMQYSKEGKLSDFLRSKGSPFAGVDILKYGREAGLTEEQTALLIGISARESNWGTAYTSTRKGYRESVPEMASVYNNPVGLKWCTLGTGECPEPNRKPDENGMWIQRYDSYDQFWQTYTKQMKRGYFDRGGDTPEIISKCYVQGDCVRVKPEWSATVTDAMNQVIKAIN